MSRARCVGFLLIDRVCAQNLVRRLQMPCRNIWEQVMHEVEAIVPRKEDNPEPFRRQNIARGVQFVLGADKPSMVQTISPIVDRRVEEPIGQQHHKHALMPG